MIEAELLETKAPSQWSAIDRELSMVISMLHGIKFPETEPRFDAKQRFDTRFTNPLTGMGIEGIDAARSTRVSDTAWKDTALTYNEFHSLMLDSFVYKYLTALPYDAIQKGWEIKLGDEDEDGQIASKVKKYPFGFVEEAQTPSIEDYFFNAQYEANAGNGYQGGAALILNIDDGGFSHEPVNYKNIRSITGITMVDSIQLTPDLTWRVGGHNVGNMTSLDQITHYYINVPVEFAQMASQIDNRRSQFKRLENQDTLVGARIHKSRLLRFDGHLLTQRLMIERYFGWSASKLPLIRNELENYRTTQQGITNMIQTASVFVHKIKDFSNKIKKGSDEDRKVMEEYLRMMRHYASVTGGLSIDMDKHVVEYVTRSFGGLDALAEQLRVSLIGASGIPHTRAFGESPGGWGSTGESQEKDWSKEVASFQMKHWYSKLKYLYRLVFLAKDGPTGGVEPKDWDVEFPSIMETTPEEEANLESIYANIDSTYANLQDSKGNAVVSIQEIRQSRFGGTKFGKAITLNKDEYEKEKAENEKRFEQEQQMMMGGGDFGANDQSVEGLGLDPALLEQIQQQQAQEQAQPPIEEKTDSDGDRTRMVLPFKNTRIGLQYLPGELKHGSKLDGCGYGYIEGMQGVDRMALDVYINEPYIAKLKNDAYSKGKLYEIIQLNEDGEFDEYKYMIGYPSKEAAKQSYLGVMPENKFGAIKTVSWNDVVNSQKMMFL